MLRGVGQEDTQVYPQHVSIPILHVCTYMCIHVHAHNYMFIVSSCGVCVCIEGEEEQHIPIALLIFVC